MAYPVFKKGFPLFATDGAGRAGSPRGEEIVSLSTRKMYDAGAYVFTEELAQAINVALLLGMPLLVTGEPGAGKTELGRAVAYELGAGDPLTFETKSTSQARDLFYTYDALGRFAAKEIGGDVQPQSYIRYHALGLAILNAFQREHIGQFLAQSAQHQGPKRSVVVIDEIDKAPRDFTNDLLNEIARMAFRVPELGNIATPGMDGGEGVPANLRPIVIITSNSERGLPDPFLRRCVYFHIPFPEGPALKEIVSKRVEGLDPNSPLATDALELFVRIRDDHMQPVVQKKPGTAELLNWLQFLGARGVTSQTSLRRPDQLANVSGSIFALVKTQDDLEAVRAYLPTWCGGG